MPVTLADKAVEAIDITLPTSNMLVPCSSSNGRGAEGAAALVEYVVFYVTRTFSQLIQGSEL